MERRESTPRPGWQKTVESQGMYYHTLDGVPYWDESAYYHFDAREINEIEECTYWLNQYCLQAVDHVIENNLFEQVGIPATHVEWVKKSWERDEHYIYGRYDLCYKGEDDRPKLLEYNADTPTGLLEAAVIQWQWMKDTQEFYDQYNEIHEQLIAAWKNFKGMYGKMWFAALAENLEDYMTVTYLRDTAIQAGMNTDYINVEDIGWHEARKQFTDLQENTLYNVFKLYPWEWMMREEFGQRLLDDTTAWLEPPWKAILSNKGILPILWELFPESPYLLPASFEPMKDNYVKKPIHAREGANIELVMDGSLVEKTDGDYTGPCIYQAVKPLPCFDGNYPVIGSWLVNGWACGIGIREDRSLVTKNTSRFVPHVFSK